MVLDASTDPIIKGIAMNNLRSSFTIKKLPVIFIVLILGMMGCAQKPSLTVTLAPAVPESMALSDVADIDWYLPSGHSGAELEKGEIIPYDRKANAGYIKGVTAQLMDQQILAFTGITNYSWSGGERFKDTTSAPVAISMLFAATTKPGNFTVTATIPTGDVYVVIHGACVGIVANVEAKLEQETAQQELNCKSDDDLKDQQWTYQLQVKNAKKKDLTIVISNLDAEYNLPGLTISAIMMSKHTLIAAKNN